MKIIFQYVLVLCFISCGNKHTPTNNVIETSLEDSKVSSWEIGHYVNDYGEAQNDHFIYQSFNGDIEGTLSNGTSMLKAKIIIKKGGYEELFNSIVIKMCDGNDYPLIGDLSIESRLKIKNMKGEEIETAIFGRDGSYELSEDDKVLQMLKECKTLKVAVLLSTQSERYARIKFSIDDNFGLQEIIDSIYSMENIDTIAALQKKAEVEAEIKKWERKRK